MSRISQQKEKYGIGNKHSEDNVNEGTAARTRPFSFAEIMLRRKKKEVTADGKDGTGDIAKLSGTDYSEKVSGYSELDGGYRRVKNSDVTRKHASKDTTERSSRKKDAISLSKEANSAKEKGKGSRDLDAKLKDKSDKDRHSKSKDSNYEKHGHHRGRNKEPVRDANESKKRYSESLVGKEKYRDSERTKSEKESRRKNLTREEEKNKDTDGSSVKKYDSGKSFDLEPAERKDKKKHSSQSHYDEPRQKRRRSRSPEKRDRDRKSVSPSPKVHKRTYHDREHGNSSSHSLKDRRQHSDIDSSYYDREHGNTSSHSLKDRSKHSDIDKNIMSSNGGYASSQRRHSGHGSKLGGYSPRKRRTEAAIKTPSPTSRSPEKKNAGWDLPPTGGGTVSSTTALSNFQPSHQTVLSSDYQLSSGVPLTPKAIRSLPEASPITVSLANHVSKHLSMDSVQLTQATRPSRRLYVENLPDSASDKAVVECFNKFLLSSSANHIQGTQACISCIMNKEKGQALVEFLTPEYAATALSFDGRCFCGSIIKVRRPKDFVEAATDVPEKSAPTVDAISDVVKDSPHKIFIGGISKVLSSGMIQEIAGAFGVLKAYRFQVNDDLSGPCAFLEFVDQSLTLKACAGLNGMKLGGQVLTAVQAIPNASEEMQENPPFYGIPEHAKPLLFKPSKVLKLTNVFNPEDVSSVSGRDLEETLEDIRLECARFGTIRSVNVVRCKSSSGSDPQGTYETDTEILHDPVREGYTEVMETVEENMDKKNSCENSCLKVADDIKEPRENVGDVKDDTKLVESVSISGTSEVCETDCTLTLEFQDSNTKHSLTQLDAASSQADNAPDFIENEDRCWTESSLIGEEGPRQEEDHGAASSELNDNVGREVNSSEEGGSKQQQVNDVDDIFEHGSILVEYLRTEASSMAAHCLHGRLYGDRVVTVNYIPHDLYLLRFPK